MGVVQRLHTKTHRETNKELSFQFWTENYDLEVKLRTYVLKVAEELAGVQSFWVLYPELHLGII